MTVPFAHAELTLEPVPINGHLFSGTRHRWVEQMLAQR